MRRSTILSLAGAVALALITVLAAGPTRAYAQPNPNCCDFIVNTSNIPASCFPITILTNWSNGAQFPVTVTTPGFRTFTQPFNCPPAPTLVSAIVASNCCLGPVTYYCGGCLFIELAFTC
jgi:hypothetical protein